jgi:hypothetical protein
MKACVEPMINDVGIRNIKNYNNGGKINVNAHLIKVSKFINAAIKEKIVNRRGIKPQNSDNYLARSFMGMQIRDIKLLIWL